MGFSLGKIAKTALKFATGGPLAVVAPFLTKALGGKMKGDAINTLAGILGVKPEGLPARMETLTAADQLALKAADQDFEVRMRELDIDVFSKEVQDKGSARAMATATGLTPHKVLTFIWAIGFFTLLVGFAMGWVKPDPLWKDIFVMLITLLVREMTGIMGFWFGSSMGSKQKSDDAAKALNSKL